MIASYNTRAKMYEIFKLNRDALMNNEYTEGRAMLISAKLLLLEEMINEDIKKSREKSTAEEEK